MYRRKRLSVVVLLWLASAPGVFAELDPPSTYGEWELNAVPAPYSPGHSAVLKNGKVLFIEESEQTNTFVWDPTTNQFSSPSSHPTSRIFCSGHAFLPSGNLLAAGGGGITDPDDPNTAQAWIYDPNVAPAGTWTRTGDMHQKRYYPTVLSLGGGNMLVFGGWTGSGDTDFADELEVYNETTGQFTIVNGGKKIFIESYPGMHLLPNGKALFSRTGFGHFGEIANDPGSTAWYFQFDNLSSPTAGTWFEVPSPVPYPDRSEGMSVQTITRSGSSYSSRVSVFGGGEPNPAGRDTAVQVNTAGADPASWTWSLHDTDMEGFGRPHPAAVLLPTGDTLVFGGGTHQAEGICVGGSNPGQACIAGGMNCPGGGVCTCLENRSTELYPAAGGAPIRMDDLTYSRGYHGVAGLLSDGRVFVSGGEDDCQSPNLETTIDIFRPPYLFRGNRPTIVNAPALINYGQSFTVSGTWQLALPIQKIVLVRPMAMTHATDTEQRVVDLSFSVVHPYVCFQGMCTANHQVQAPGGTPPYPHAPSGYYMLFIVDGDGVPSLARFVRLQ